MREISARRFRMNERRDEKVLSPKDGIGSHLGQYSRNGPSTVQAASTTVGCQTSHGETTIDKYAYSYLTSKYM